MAALPLAVYLLLLLDAGITTLPAPVKVVVDSVNFNHILRWDPGLGTPPGARYSVFTRKGKRWQVLNSNVTNPWIKMKLANTDRYQFAVQALFNKTQSPRSRPVTFTPFQDTIITPPALSLTGCGNCIQVSISLPEADSGAEITDIQDFYRFVFRVYWKKDGEAEMRHYGTTNKTSKLVGLESYTKYCVKVDIKTALNPNVQPSDWSCAFTSTRLYMFLGIAAVCLLVVGLMLWMYCSCATGLLCLKIKTPQALLGLIHRYIMTPERTIPDPISITSEMNGPKRRNNRTMPQPAAMDSNSSEDEEEEGDNAYVDRNAHLSSGETSCQDSCDVSGNSKPAVSGDSGSLRERLLGETEAEDAEFDPPERGRGQYEAKGAGADVSVVSDGAQTGTEGRSSEDEEDMKEGQTDSSGNVNLFTITLNSSERDGEEGEEEEEEDGQITRDSLMHFQDVSSGDFLLPTDTQRTLSQTESQCGNDTELSLMQLEQLDFIEAGYQCRRALNVGQGPSKVEEEEEEDFSGYMGRT